MGLSEILGLGANVVLKLRADTSQAREELKKLTGEERKAAEAAIKLAEAENKKLESRAKRYQFVAQAVGGVTAAIGIGKQGLEAYAKTSDKAAQEVKKIQDVAGKAFDGMMASIGKTVMSLEPLITGVSKLVTLLNDAGVAGPAAIGALGLAITGNPVVAGIMGMTAYGLNQRGKGAVSNVNRMVMGAVGQSDKTVYDAMGQIVSDSNLRQQSPYLTQLAGRGVFGGGSTMGPSKTSLSGEAKLIVVDPKSKTVTVELLDPDDVQSYGLRRNIMTGPTSASFGQAVDQYGVGAERERSGIDAILNRQRAAFDAGSRGLMNPYAASGSGIRGAQESQLAQVFGPLSDFNAYATAFDTLSGAVGSALGAWIDGSMSAGKAFKAFIGEAVKGLAVQMTIEALKHGAYAIGSVAMGNFAGAALHGKAAAGFALGAGAAAVAAKGLIGGGSPATGGGYAPSAPNTSIGSGGSGSAGHNITIVYGDSFAQNNPHEQQLQAERMVARGFGASRRAVRAA